MLCIMNSNNDAYFNAAAEDYLLSSFPQDVFMLWRNRRAISVGKHQNALGEINLEFVRERDVQVSRRLSGGGAVYHDLGNLCYTFIRRGERGKQVDFRAFTAPALEVLNELGAEAYFSGKSDLMIGGHKISGNAEHVRGDKTLHHGTLLFSTDLEALEAALKVNPEKYADKAVKSIRKKVTNISGHIKRPMSVEEFASFFMRRAVEKFDGARIYEFTAGDIAAIEKLRAEKFATWEWNFGWTADYELSSEFQLGGEQVGMKLRVERGIVSRAEIATGLDSLRRLAEEVIGARHSEPEIRKAVKNSGIMPGLEDEIISRFF